MVDLLATQPAKLFGLYPRKGTVAVGSDADLVIFDPAKRETLSAAGSHSKCDYNLYEGTEVVGAPEIVLLRGNVLVENGELVGTPGHRPLRAPGALRRAARGGGGSAASSPARARAGRAARRGRSPRRAR